MTPTAATQPTHPTDLAPATAPHKRLLLINPNTSESISTLMHGFVQQAAGAQTQVRTVTARFGASYISSQASYAIAAHATLDAWASACAADDSGQPWQPDAVLIGCFGDPGLLALREVCPVPVTGLAQAAMQKAAALGKFGIVTGGSRWKPMLAQLAQNTGTSGLAAIATVCLTGGQMAADPEGARAVLRQACLDLLAEHDVQAIVLGGAGLAGQAAHLAAHIPVPLIDCVQAGTELALSLPAPPADEHGALPATPWRELASALNHALVHAQQRSAQTAALT